MTTARAKPMPPMTVDAFLEWDGGGHVGKLELVNGVVRAMSPASATHGVIQSNLAYLIGAHLRAKNMPCRVGTETPVIPRMDSKINLRAPDLAVSCAPPSTSKTFDDPILIVEVLSPGNSRETWEAIWACATIPTVSEFLIVDSEKIHVQVFRKGSDGSWPQEAEVIKAGGIAHLTSIGAELAVADIYANTQMKK
jgi:Uma2 family endonuclease